MLQFAENKENWKKLFFLIWTGQAFSLLGSSLVQFALVWWMTEKTGSAAILATGTFVSLLPQVFLGPFAGALIDRWDRRKIMILADAGIAIATMIIVILFWQNIIQIWQVFTLLFIRAVGGTFHWAAIQASTSLMVPDKQLSRVAGMNQTLNGVVSLAAPPLGALLLAALPMYVVLSVDIITALLAITPLLFILIPQPKTNLDSSSTSMKAVFSDVKIGFMYVFNWRGLFFVLIIAAVINFLIAPVNTFLPLLVTKHFNGGVWQVGWIETAMGSGIILGGVSLSVWGGFKKRILTSLCGLMGMALGIMIIALAPSQYFWMALVGMGITGIMVPIVNGPFMAIIQSNVEPEMQGRVFSLVGAFCGAMMPLSMIVSVPIVEQFGTQSWYLFSGIVCFIMVAIAFFIPELLEIEKINKNDSLIQIANSISTSNGD
jgi:DHA3 family macrolide efflux protein-like MFS transporter